MMKAGVHFGHGTRKWNPKMAPYISAKDSVARAAIKARCHYVNKKWPCSMLTNWSTTEARLHKFRNLRTEQKMGRLNRLPKRDAAMLPDIVIVVDQHEEYTALLMDLFQQLKSQPLWYLFLLVISFFSILNSFYSILTRLYANFRRPPTNLTTPNDSVAAATVYEVFLSFRGTDTRKGITDYLYHDLVGASIQTFRDNEELWVGKEIGPELLKAIKESKISIPIFSKNYADSKWCLLELEQIVKCHKSGGQKIYPIFYDVDPSDVRNQEGSYKLAFNLHKKKFDEGTVQRWRDALKVVGELKGLELKKETDGHEGKLVKLVVEKVLMELKKNYTHIPGNLVGMDNHIKKMMGLLEVDSADVRIVGIHGMGGLGKTTISKVIYNEICKNFDGQCFLDNVRERSEKHDGIVELQKQFISSVQKRGVPSVSDVNHGRNLIEGVVRSKKLLLVLDDVDDYVQVDMIMGEPSWYGEQSRVILTTRDKAVVDVLKLNCESKDPFVVYKSYNPYLLDKIDSLKLFSKHAFKKDFPNKEYNSLSTEVVSIAAGLPLVLVVLGSTFFPLMDKGDLWKEKLRQLRKIPHKDVLKQLKFSFDALEETEKEIFLDIACLFIGHNKTRPTYMWESCELYPNLGIHVLVSKSLITINDDDEFQMHDQLRDLGREILRQEGLHGKQSRLWCTGEQEALQVLGRNQGTSFVNALRLQSRNSVVAPHFHLLPNLRYLCMKNVRNVDGDFKDLLPNLRWLECQRMLDNSSLRNLNMKNLVVLDLSSCSKLTDEWDGWSQLKMANNLKVLDLSYCENLRTLPNLSNLTKLVELDLSYCGGLTEIQGLEKLEILQVLKITCCYSLRRIPNISSLKDLKVFNAEECWRLRQIKGLSGLKSLEYLQLTNCISLKEGLGDLSNLNKLQVLKGGPGSLDLTTDLSNFKKLKKLVIDKSNRSEIQNLDGLVALENLVISDCSYIVRLPNLSYLNRLKTLMINMYEQLIEIPDLSELKSLEELTISNCSSMVRLPNLSYLNRLKTLEIWYCDQLIEIPDLSELKLLEELSICECGIEALPDLSPLQKLKYLDVEGCHELSEIRGIEELKCLEMVKINNCRSVKALPDLSALQKLKYLDVSYCKKLSEIPGIKELKCLKDLYIRGCDGLGHLLELDLPNVTIYSDIEIEEYPPDENTEDSKIEEYPTDENTEDSEIEEYPTDENT